MIYAIASLFDVNTDDRTKELWDWIQCVCGLEEISISPIPHFSWFVGESLLSGEVEQSLVAAASNNPPFEVNVVDVGIFTGEHPIVYLGLQKDKTLMRLHQSLRQAISQKANGTSPFYEPDEWIPHITLAYHEHDLERLACTVRQLVYGFHPMKLSVKEIGLIYQNLDQYGVAMQYAFTG
ncbi:MAG: 2'-5' RNA ligase family protein [Chloroflexi bacterium]|nr:2'-5' RNA ligase family protein [Chloroflexota bacterium]